MKNKRLKFLAAALAFLVIPVLSSFLLSLFGNFNLLLHFSVGLCLLCFTAIAVLVRYILKINVRIKQDEEIFRHLPVSLCVSDSSGRILRLHAEGLDQGRNTLRTKVADLAASPEDRELLWMDVLETFRQATERTRTFSSQQKRITYRKMEHGYSGRDAVLICSWNVSQLYSTQEKMKKVERLHNTLFNGGLTGILILDEEGRILAINRSGAGLLELENDEVAGMECLRVFHPVLLDSPEPFETLLDKTLKEGGRYEFSDSVRLTLRNGREIPIYLKCESVTNENGSPEAVVVRFRDHSSREQSASDLRETKRILSLSASLVGAGYFELNVRTREVRYEENCEQFWPVKNGIPLSEQLWVHRDDLAEFLEKRERLLSGKDKIWDSVYRSEYLGRPVWYRICAVLKVDEYGDKIIEGTIQAVSDLREFILNHDENAFMLRMIMKSLPCIFFIKEISNDYRYVMYSDKGYEIFGFKPNQVIGKTDFEVFGTTETAKIFRKQDQNANNTRTASEVTAQCDTC